MQVILLENIINLGKVGDQVKVKDGYGRNFLLKFGKALRVNKENVEYVNKKKDELNKKNLKIKKEFKEIAKQIDNKILKISKETKENGELYAPIKPKEISTILNDNFKVVINPSNILIKSEINSEGKFKVEIKLHSEVSAIIYVVVSKTGLFKK